MKEKFIQSLYTHLIARKGYTPIRKENGEIAASEGVRILQSASADGFFLTEIIDADLFSAEEIQERLDNNSNALKRFDSRNFCQFIDVFVFKSNPDPQKLQIITTGQFKKVMGKKYLTCLSVDLEEKSVGRYFKLPLMASSAEKAIKEILATDWEAKYEDTDINELVESKEREIVLQFAAQKPFVTYSLLVIITTIWVIMNAYATIKGLDINSLLFTFGEKDNLKIMQGEYWRFLTPMFLHANLVHLLINSFSLYQVGGLVERLFGHKKFIVIYLIAGIIGNIASFMFSISPAVGASGAIFGLLGALLYFGVERPEAFKRYFGSGVITTIIINIAYGISHSGIDNFAHLGGLAGGFLASGIVKYEKAAKKYLKTPLLIALTLLITVAGLFYGFNNNQNTILKKVETLRQLNAESKWSEAEKTGEEILSKNPSDINTRFQTLWALTYMEASTGNYEKAFKYANMMKDVDEPRSHYLLGALYFDTKQYDLAKQELEMAKAQNPDMVEEIDQLLNELNNVNK